jgi:hypothetical protein
MSIECRQNQAFEVQISLAAYFVKPYVANGIEIFQPMYGLTRGIMFVSYHRISTGVPTSAQSYSNCAS